MKYKSTLMIATLLLSGCVSVEFSKTGNYSVQPKGPNCDFVVYTTRPDQPFKEVGVVDLVGSAPNLPKTVSKTKEKVKEKVCASGGNGLLLWEANGFGGYTKGTVIYIQD